MEIFPLLYETFVYLFKQAGIKNIQIEKTVDFQKMYDKRKITTKRKSSCGLSGRSVHLQRGADRKIIMKIIITKSTNTAR